MKSAWFGAAALAAMFVSAFGARAQAVPENGVFDRFLSPGAPECVPVSAFESVSKVTELSPAQFEFVRALYIALPPMSQKLPPGDHAVVAKAGGVSMLAIVDGAQACARFVAPDFILGMLDEVGQGRTAHIGTPAVVQRQVATPYRLLPQLRL